MTSKSRQYYNKTALVTGGASGIGQALCNALVEQGAIVYAADIAYARSEAETDLGQFDHTQINAIFLDVTDAEACRTAVRRICDEHGQIDYLFNCAGLAMVAEVHHMTLDHWAKISKVNVDGVLHCIDAVYPIMIEQGTGHIVNVGSVAGFLPVPGSAAYAMTKHALTGLTLSLRGEAESFGVEVSLVCPGFIDTPLLTQSPILGLDANKMVAHPLRAHLMKPRRCADLILRRIRKKRAIVTITGHAWWLYRLYRLFPALFNRWLLPAGMVMNRKEYALPTDTSESVSSCTPPDERDT